MNESTIKTPARSPSRNIGTTKDETGLKFSFYSIFPMGFYNTNLPIDSGLDSQ